MSEDFKFLMLGAMYENGGNTTHRLLDGHPGLRVYPFESQVGTRLVQDLFTSTFPQKYRWPVFSLDATPVQDYRAIIDEECKVRARTPHVSKFRHMPFDMDDDQRLSIYEEIIGQTGRSTANNMAAFFRSTFEAWHDYVSSGEEQFYVGYSPVITVDTERILSDLPQAHVLHVVRNPWSAYADTKKRPVPMSLKNYMTAWCINQHFALTCQKMYPDRVHVLRTEDTFANPVGALGGVLEKMGLESNPSLGTVTWNSVELEEVYPWGTIRQASSEANLETARELSPNEMDEVRDRAGVFLDLLDYKSFL